MSYDTCKMDPAIISLLKIQGDHLRCTNIYQPKTIEPDLCIMFQFSTFLGLKPSHNLGNYNLVFIVPASDC